MLAIVVGLLSLLPIGYLFVAGTSAHDLARLFGYASTLPTVLRTLGLTLSVAALSLVFAIAAATLVVRTNMWLRRTCTVLFALPLAIPGFVSAYAVYSLALYVAPQSSLLTTFGGATVVLSLVLYPYVFLPCVVALSSIDRAQEEVASTLRSRPVTRLVRVVLPQLRQPLAGGLLIVALHVLAEYGALVQLRQQTLTTSIMGEMLDYGNYRSARSISLLLAVIAFAVLAANRLFAGRGFPLRSSASPQAAKVHRLGRWQPVALLAALIVPAAALGPTVFMTIRGLVLAAGRHTAGWTSVATAAGHSLGYALGAAAIGTVVALPVSWWLARRPSPLAHLTERSVWLAHALPNAILALALVSIATQLVPGLYKTGLLLILAYVLLFLPLAVSNQRVGLRAALTGYEDVAASLGSGALARFWRVSLPLALPGIATGGLLLGLDATKELTTTLMLLPFNTQTLATGLWQTTNGQTLDFSAAAPYSVVLLALGAIPVLLIARRTLRFVR
jgi:iron(III) transport system permease protein